MRPRATRQTDWAQLGMGACALVLAPLALGATLYSMLTPPDDGTARPAGTTAVVQPDAGRQPEPPAALPVTAVSQPAAGPQRSIPSAQGRAPDQDVPAPLPVVPATVVSPPAFAEGAAILPPTENPPAPAAPKRPIPHRTAQRQPQQQQDPVRAILQHIGILPPYH
jgi:hypothetical protein